MGYAGMQRLRLALVIISPVAFTLQLFSALANPGGLGFLVAAFFAAVGLYIAYDYRKAKTAHERAEQAPRKRA